MVVDDLDIGRSLIGPHEADAPLVVDTHRMLSRPVALEVLEVIARREPEILENTAASSADNIARVRLTRSAGNPLPKRSATALAASLPFVPTIMSACITT